MKETKRITVAEYLTKRIDESDKTQKDIALEIGYENPNVITMFKQGHTKLPLTAVGPLAVALAVDPAYLLRLVLLEYYPETYEAIEGCLGTMILTDRERTLVTEYRRRTNDNDPEMLIFKDRRVLALVIS